MDAQSANGGTTGASRRPALVDRGSSSTASTGSKSTVDGSAVGVTRNPSISGGAALAQDYTKTLREGLPSLSTFDMDFSDVAITQASPGTAHPNHASPSLAPITGSSGEDAASPDSSVGSPYHGSLNREPRGSGSTGMSMERRPSSGLSNPKGSYLQQGRGLREEDGVVTGAIAETGRAGSSTHAAITPWLFQDELVKAAPIGRHGRAATADIGAIPGASHHGASASTLSLRPTTPPGTRSPMSGSTVLPSTASTSSFHSPANSSVTPTRKSRNPFSFLRKKNSAILRETPEECAPPPLPSAREGRSMTTPSLARQPSYHNSIFLARSGKPSDVSPAQGLDDELASVEAAQASGGRHASTSGAGREKKRVLRRPRTRERERSRGPEDGSTDATPGGLGAPFGFGVAGSAAGGREVEMSLDTNFDQIDDIVDPRMRQTSIAVGPMNEQRSPPPDADAAHPASVSASLGRSRRRSTSVSATETGEVSRFAQAQNAHLADRPNLRRLGSADPSATNQSHAGRGQSQQRIKLGQPGLRRITLAEAKQHLTDKSTGASVSVSNPSPRETTGAEVFAPWSVPGEDPMHLVRAGGPSSGDIRELRKDSTTSSISQRSGYSGVSPKSSITNLNAARGTQAETHPWNKNHVADPTYRFPPPTNGNLPGSLLPAGAFISADALGQRKSSSSSGNKAASTWMAPDSWAVQPDRLRDYLRDEDDSSNDEAEGDDVTTSAGSGRRQGDRDASSGSGSMLAGHVGGSGLFNKRSSSLEGTQSMLDGGARRGTQDSVLSGYSSGHGGADHDHELQRQQSLEILAIDDPVPPRTPHTAHTPHSPSLSQSTSAFHLPLHHMRPASRGGAALAAAGGAAAAAAGKLGLGRSNKQGKTSRPNTAGSIGANTRATTVSPTATIMPTADDDTVTASSSRSIRGITKRPSTLASQSIGRPFIMRIYKGDGTHATIALPLYATTAELRSIMLRKVPSAGAGGYRMFVTDKGHERPLGEAEKPAMLQRRRMEQAGYTENDSLEELGAEDLSYLLKFSYRPDSVTKFDSESFGSTEDRFRLLDLTNHNLEMVPIFLYRHADWIGSLDLSGNPMSDLPLDFVQLCTSLHTLRLSHLALKRIPQSIRSSETLTHLDVSDNRIPDLSHIALDEMSSVTSIKIQNNRLVELPGYFSRITTLRYLNISNNRFEAFPQILCEVQGLVELDISFNAISSIPDEIGNLIRLERLVLVGNSIETLPSTFAKLVNLQSIDVRRNMLQDVSVFFTLPRLQSLLCENNSLKVLDAHVLPQLRSLSIGQNPLSKATLTALEPGALTSLDLSSANMAKLEETVFKNLPSLQTLILDRNQFVTLPDSIGELAQLDFLSCTNNLLAALPESIGKLGKLRRLHLHNNNLKSLPNSIWMCSSLASINASSNLLESFPSPPLGGQMEYAGASRGSASGSTGLPGPDAAALAQQSGMALDQARKGSGTSIGGTLVVPQTPGGARAVFAMAQKLKKLRLGDNRLTDDVFGVLGLLTELEILNLSFNEIYEIPGFGLSLNTRLTELYLSGNNLNSIPADDLPRLKDLTILHLNGNKLQTLPAELKEMRRLHNLDVGNNTLKYNIANQQYDWNWNSSPALRYLNLSGNKRLEVKGGGGSGGGSGSGRANGRATYRRQDAVASDFQRLTNLRVLGLMDVTVTLRQEELPDGHDDRRVRTSESHINGMAYGIADALGKSEHLSINDTVFPKFRGQDNEGLVGLFEGRHHGRHVGSRISSHLAQWVAYRIQYEIKHYANTPDDESPDSQLVPDVLRRAFLRLEKEYADLLMVEGSRKQSEARVMAAQDDRRADAPAIAESTHLNQWRAGASAVLAYVVGRTLHVANVGDALAVLSRNGSAHLVSVKHEPFDREETTRIRSAEGWVSLRGHVNDMLDVSRSFGYYHLSSVVNARPAVTTVQLSDSDEFVILANRTLWDHVSYQTAIDIARMERSDVMIAAQKLRDFAISYGAEESIMVMVVAVGDLFGNRQQRNESTTFESSIDAYKKGTRSRGARGEELPGDRTLARLEREVAPPIGQVALVFTDIKNSTSLWETNGGMQSAMRMHNYLLRRQLRTIGGYEVKTEGDAFMVSFPSVTAALLWCFTVQAQLLREDWPQELLECEDGREVHDSEGVLIHRGLSVRMGIHWGFPVCEADPITRRMDYFGPMVNRSSRISSAADGGQIMASKDVITELTAVLGSFGGDADQLNDSASLEAAEADEEALQLLHPNVARDVVLLRRMGFGISEVGERRLKGLETPELLYLLYPKQLEGRLAGKPGAIAPQVFEPTPQLLDIGEIRQLGMLCLRLEALSDGHVHHSIVSEASAESGVLAIEAAPTAETVSDGALVPQSGSLDADKGAMALLPVSGRRKALEMHLTLRPELLIYAIRDDAPDAELIGIMQQLTSRIVNALSTISLRHLAARRDANTSLKDLSSLLALLSQSAA
ncbi:PP2C-domain-containing protein [Ceraceosorus guamensis]|uniref:PP2C-domain-containing protein n=1 Tax=Ceraceosorus guamensis TaxID=1522189 RepID=A0A316VYN3_9BASI|nr:PP2C-domain-containing protein [Ceraceosorus guamensis]PWN41371.1 PP2C-domain-containing protein [Ceraceosorus guamensis]